MHTKREKRHVIKATVPLLLTSFALVFCCATDAGAQADGAQEPPSDEPEPAAVAARHLLESALTSEDGRQRFPALRAARFMDEPWISEIVLPLCDSPDPIERVLALEVVANTDPRPGRAAFLKALTSPERALRLRGLLGLAALGDPDTVPKLVDIMEKDPDPDLRAAAARALGEMGDTNASIPLFEAIDSEYPPVREQAVLALIAIGEDDVGERLVRRLQNKGQPGEAEILRLLALIPDPALVEDIEPYMEDGYDASRILAAAAILSILERSGHTRP